MEILQSSLGAWVVLGVLFILIYVMYMFQLRSKYPPGPWPLPIIGNLHSFSSNMQFDLANLAKTYGPVFTVWFGQQPGVIVCNLEIAKEGLIKKGAYFADRGTDKRGFALFSFGNEDFATRRYDEKYIVMRNLSLSINKPMTAIQDETRHLLHAIKRKGTASFDPDELVTLTVSNIITKIIFSTRCDSEHDPKFQELKAISNDLRGATKTCVLVDVFPLLWYILPSLKRGVLNTRNRYLNFVKPITLARKDTYNEHVIRDMFDAVINAAKKTELEKDSSQRLTPINEVMLVVDLLVGGIHTTVDALLWAFAALLQRPDIQASIHNELDQYLKQDAFTFNSKVGISEQNEIPERFINFDSRANLSYLNAFIHETLRRCAPGPLGLQHKTRVNSSLGSFMIPQDTAVIFNIYAISNDENTWSNPSEFRPERFLDKDGSFNVTAAKSFIPFGTGYRKCVGDQLAKSVLFVLLANILIFYRVKSSDKIPFYDDGILATSFQPRPYKMQFEERLIAGE